MGLSSDVTNMAGRAQYSRVYNEIHPTVKIFWKIWGFGLLPWGGRMGSGGGGFGMMLLSCKPWLLTLLQLAKHSLP